MLMIFAGILITLMAIVQLVLEEGIRFWRDAIFWIMFVTVSALSVMAYSAY
jgi:hypothetical protein